MSLRRYITSPVLILAIAGKPLASTMYESTCQQRFHHGIECYQSPIAFLQVLQIVISR
jgi:hypothetical protein